MKETKQENSVSRSGMILWFRQRKIVWILGNTIKTYISKEISSRDYFDG